MAQKHAYLNLLIIGVLILEYLLIGISDLEHHSDWHEVVSTCSDGIESLDLSKHLGLCLI